MKRKSLVKFTKRIMAGFLSVAMILIGILVTPETAEATESATSVYFATAEEYKMSDYWDGTDNKVPVKAGYVFGGWYNKDKTTPLKNVVEADDTAVAKFVPAEVLSIKTQVGTSTSEGKTITSMRILSTVDSTNYQAVGFQYKLAANDTAWTENITKVYSAIRPYKGSPDSATQEPGETFVDGVSQYFIAADVSSISAESEAKIVYARPFWITLDGTKVMGLARNNRVEDKDPDKDLEEHYTSVGINLLTDGKAAAAVAAGKIRVTYNTDNYDVVGTPDITTDATNGGTYLFEEMECHVDEDAGTITFVGNAETVKANSIADGLFANIRFEKAANNTGDALDFTVETEATEFCDWSETDVTQQVFVQ